MSPVMDGPTGDLLQVTIFLVALTVDLAASGHAVVTKRDGRSAWAWCLTIWLLPICGPLLYVLFGINRIERKAVKLRRRRGGLKRVRPVAPAGTTADSVLPACYAYLLPLVTVGDAVTGHPLLGGNAVRALVNGSEAYPAMVAAIDSAQASVGLQCYIFENDAAGRMLLAAMARAVARGVDVHFLVDDVGAGRGCRALVAAATAVGVRTEVFLPLAFAWRTRLFNLRNHRKLLVVDGRLGFAGGLNVRAGDMAMGDAPPTELDVHFALEGPVVQHLVEAFADDWAFTTGTAPEGEGWWKEPAPAGEALARGLAWDPGTRRDSFKWLLVAALGCARESVRIVTPYFIPDAAIAAALNVAALRGVAVDIILPQVSDVRVVQWASDAMLWEVLLCGCRVWKSPPPFDHAKLVVVDSTWTLFGSANLDSRSLRLNFEFNVECHDAVLAKRVEELIAERLARSRQVTLAEVDGGSWLLRLRNGLARLAAPFL